jgi:ABC-type nitrate/sulfonate/bicarbonate transport system ATPase subunit
MTDTINVFHHLPLLFIGVLRRTLPYDNCHIGFVTSNTILTTHYLEEADALAHRIIVINKGTEIAAELHLSEGTVRNCLSEAIAKLGASNRVDAARIARVKGWL